MKLDELLVRDDEPEGVYDPLCQMCTDFFGKGTPIFPIKRLIIKYHAQHKDNYPKGDGRP